MLSVAPKITDEGKRFIISAISGETITFTKFKIGNGELPGDSSGEELNDLINPLITFPITSINKSSAEYVKIEGSFDSTYIKDDFRWRELGLYCKGKDDVEILYAYANDGDNAGMLKANATDVIAEQSVSLIIAVGDAENVTAIMTESALYAPKAELDAHIADKSNPHKVDKGDVGLDNVPNVTTNDQTPTYNMPISASELESGEKISTAFGKIARAVKDVIAHIANKSNPHNVTLTDVGGAAKAHTHSTADVTSGVLSTVRGGTGVSSYSALATALGSYIHTPYFGTYAGDGTRDRIISLPFTPKCVILMDCEGNTGDDVHGYSGGIAMNNFNVSIYGKGNNYATTWDNNYSVLGIVTNGFKINYHSSNKVYSNVSGKPYCYIAFR